MDTEILKYILSSQGAVDLEELECNIGDASLVAEIIGSNDKLVVCSVSGTRRVVARSRVRLCRDEACPGCGGLHQCRLLLLSGVCPFLQTRGCFFCHDLRSEYNMEVLREFGLEALSRTELCLLLLQSNNTLLPQICHDYNNRSGCPGNCQYLHICERYLHRNCRCFRTHDFFAPQPLKLLQKKHIPDHLIKALKSVYANKEALRLADKENGKNNSSFDISNENEFDESNQDLPEDTPADWAAYDSDTSSTISTKQDESNLQVTKKRRTRGGKGRRRNGQRKNTSAAAEELRNTENTQDPNTTAEMCEGGYSDSSRTLRIAHSKDGGGAGVGRTRVPLDSICMFFIRGQCKHGDSCVKAHDMMPYRWQIKQGAFWTPMAENETIEKEYCDPQNTTSTTCLSVHFDRMKSGQNKVRRLSTVSSVVKPNYSHTTHWLWYRQEESGTWHQYEPSEREFISITSKDLEEKYLKNNKEVVRFVADSQLYELSFQDMTERNLDFGTKRSVRRRPRFVSAAEVKKQRKSTTNITAVSEYVDKMQINPKGPTNILLSAAQLTTTASTANELLKYSIVPQFYLATPQVYFTTTSKTTSGPTATSVNTVLSTNATQKTNVQVASPLATATSTATSSATSSANTTLRSPVPQFTSAPATPLTNAFSTTASTSGLKSSQKVSTDLSRSPMPTITSDAKSQKAFSISQVSAIGFVPSGNAKLATPGTNTPSAVSTSSQLSNPFSSAEKSQVTTSKTAQSHFKSSAVSPSGLKSSNQFSVDSEYSKFANTTMTSSTTSGLKSANQFSVNFQPSKAIPTNSQSTFSTSRTSSADASTSAKLTKSANPFSPASSVDRTLMAATANQFSIDFKPSKSQFTYETTTAPIKTPQTTFSTSGTSSANASTSAKLTKSSNPFSTDFNSECSKLATTMSQEKQFTFKTVELRSPVSHHSSSTTSGLKSANWFSGDFYELPTNSQTASSTSRTSSANASTSAKLTKSANPFSPASSVDRTASATAKAPTSPSTTLKTPGLKPSNQFSTNLTASKFGVTTTTSGTNSPNAFSVSTKPQLESKMAPAFSHTTTISPTQPASGTRSWTTPDTTSAPKPQSHHSSVRTNAPNPTPSRTQRSSATFVPKPEFEVDTAFTSATDFHSTKSSVTPRPTATKNKTTCVIS